MTHNKYIFVDLLSSVSKCQQAQNWTFCTSNMCTRVRKLKPKVVIKVYMCIYTGITYFSWQSLQVSALCEQKHLLKTQSVERQKRHNSFIVKKKQVAKQNMEIIAQ